MADVLIASIPKNSREEIRICLSEYHGHSLANLRVWFLADDDQMRPGKHGLAFRLDKLTTVIDGLTALAAEAKHQGLIE